MLSNFFTNNEFGQYVMSRVVVTVAEKSNSETILMMQVIIFFLDPLQYCCTCASTRSPHLSIFLCQEKFQKILQIIQERKKMNKGISKTSCRRVHISHFPEVKPCFPFCCNLNLKEYLQVILNSWSHVSQQRDFVLPLLYKTRGKTFCNNGVFTFTF